MNKTLEEKVMIVNLVNPATGQAKQAKIGFSWTVFFFGCFPALFRGDLKWFFTILIANFFTAGFSNLVFMFIYNKLYLNDLLLQGFRPADEFSKDRLIAKGFFFNYDRKEANVDDMDDLDF